MALVFIHHPLTLPVFHNCDTQPLHILWCILGVLKSRCTPREVKAPDQTCLPNLWCWARTESAKRRRGPRKAPLQPILLAPSVVTWPSGWGRT